jgi:hypothetical protein
MDAERRLLTRLERIEALDRDRAPAELLLGELRGLVADAEAWARAEHPGDRAARAIDACREALDSSSLEAAMG